MVCADQMKKPTFLIKMVIFLVSIAIIFNIAKAEDCTEYKQGERLYLELINQTTNGVLSGYACNITFFDLTHNSILGNATTTEIAGTGLYYFVLNGSFSNRTVYLATAYCKNNIVSHYEFCMVVNSTRELVNSTSIAESVWNYAARTLTSFGTLIADIWAYAARTLSSYGTLITDMWEYSARNITSGGTTATEIWEYTDRNLTWENTTGGDGTTNYNTSITLILPVS